MNTLCLHNYDLDFSVIQFFLCSSPLFVYGKNLISSLGQCIVYLQVQRFYFWGERIFYSTIITYFDVEFSFLSISSHRTCKKKINFPKLGNEHRYILASMFVYFFVLEFHSNCDLVSHYFLSDTIDFKKMPFKQLFILVSRRVV